MVQTTARHAGWRIGEGTEGIDSYFARFGKVWWNSWGPMLKFSM